MSKDIVTIDNYRTKLQRVVWNPITPMIDIFVNRFVSDIRQCPKYASGHYSLICKSLSLSLSLSIQKQSLADVLQGKYS